MALQPAEPAWGGRGDGVLVAQAQQGGEFLLGQFLHAGAHVVLQHEIKEELLLAVEAGGM
jgi:hypothetical protein